MANESPRSVANLIGRFEIQSKRNTSQSGGISGSSRSSSVVSQTSTNGDAANAEIKEKREWPPKPVSQQQEKSAFALPSYLRPSVGSLASTVASSLASAQSGAAGGPGKTAPTPPKAEEDAGTPAASVTPGPLTTSRSNSRASSISISESKPKRSQTIDTAAAAGSVDEAEPDTPKPGAIQRKASMLTITPATSRASDKTPTIEKPLTTAKAASVAKPKVPAPPKTPVKPTAKGTATPRKTLTPASSMQALKPQHTGQSVASTSGASRKATRPSVPSTPSRSKTPSKATPSRTKSPTAALPQRAKTPSTGLYAPTAASLARSRTASDAPPPPTIRKFLSSEAAERLSKPTAASLSKARTPAAVASPRPSISATPVKRTATAPATPLKGSSSTVTRIATTKKSLIASPQAKRTTAPRTKAVAASGALAGAATAAIDEGVVGQATAEALATEDEHVEFTPEHALEGSAPTEPEPHVGDVTGVVTEPANGDVPEDEAKSPPVVDPVEPAKNQAPETNGSKIADDLADIVNMLEAKPLLGADIAKAKATANALAIAEIPDEE